MNCTSGSMSSANRTGLCMVALLELDLQQLRRGFTQHGPALSIAEPRRLENMIDRLVLPRDRMVGADDELARADFGGQVSQRLRGEDERVVVHLPEILGRL